MHTFVSSKQKKSTSARPSCPATQVSSLTSFGSSVELTCIIITTDTRHYWQLTNNIFRYNHYHSGNYTVLKSGIHTVNESGSFTESHAGTWSLINDWNKA